MPAGEDLALNRADKICEICGDEIRRSGGITCDAENCSISLHTKCFENIAKLFFTERKNWRCEVSTIKCQSTPNTPATDVIVLHHEVECLNGEKELLVNLNSELKCNNELLKEKLSFTSSESSSYAEKTRGPLINQANTGMNEQSRYQDVADYLIVLKLSDTERGNRHYTMI
ncbi:unnamed protein product [Acanthoscelides obtectus]|uniref:PHD-type domain-containing protein n=1 Tax=Acanthoscelides obtectus TaxID=200917 RepID=A0A9P0LCB5_ACAOB|nr:unnamed protein product [Acanthoscelides obtectus]CAK1630972.1 hypothetical protein AOBTE_LOCUS6684 [Acanthoscelides obtectus]